MNVFYRVTYHNNGVYNELKKAVNQDVWLYLLSLNEFIWLPKPPTYVKENKSYFTQKGYERFRKDTLPIISNYLDKSNIQIETFENVENIIYSDEYQVVSQNRE